MWHRHRLKGPLSAVLVSSTGSGVKFFLFAQNCRLGPNSGSKFPSCGPRPGGEPRAPGGPARGLMDRHHEWPAPPLCSELETGGGVAPGRVQFVIRIRSLPHLPEAKGKVFQGLCWPGRVATCPRLPQGWRERVGCTCPHARPARQAENSTHRRCVGLRAQAGLVFVIMGSVLERPAFREEVRLS